MINLNETVVTMVPSFMFIFMLTELNINIATSSKNIDAYQPGGKTLNFSYRPPNTTKKRNGINH